MGLGEKQVAGSGCERGLWVQGDGAKTQRGFQPLLLGAVWSPRGQNLSEFGSFPFPALKKICRARSAASFFFLHDGSESSLRQGCVSRGTHVRRRMGTFPEGDTDAGELFALWRW